MKNGWKIALLLTLICTFCSAQNKFEREHRIKKSQFPKAGIELFLKENTIKQQKFYREIDNSQARFITKFKRDRLSYFMTFDEQGQLLNMGFGIKKVDIPSESNANIEAYLSANFDKVKIRRMFQQYVVVNKAKPEKTIKDAFQNMLLPENLYKLIIAAKKERKRVEYNVYFNAEGNFISIRQTLPANYDHVLY